METIADRELRTQVAPPVPVMRRPRRRRKWRPTRAVRYAIIIFLAIVFVAPFAYMLTASMQTLDKMFSNPPQWIPTDPTVENFKVFFGIKMLPGQTVGASNVGRWFFNSGFVALTVTVLQLFFNSLAAYAIAKRRFPGRDLIFVMFLATMMIPGQVTLIPTYLVLKHVPFFGGNDLWGAGGHGWLDSYYGLILPSAVSAFGVFLLRQYMATIRDELLDAARIDGASEFMIYRRIVLPLAKPALAATGIFTFIYAWEDFFWPLIIISSPDKYTVPLGLALYVVRNRTAWDIVMAGSVLATLPMILMFAVFQRHFIRGLAITGLKG